MTELKIPKEVLNITETLEKAGFEAYVIGGCVRDLLLGNTPKDWDVTTNATPEQIQKLFEETFYENEYGTVGVVVEHPTDESLRVIEVTPYRLEAKYSDSRHPDSVTFGTSLEEDLKRRDFTINAIAYSPSKKELVDLFGGQEDLKRRTIRAVGKPEERFKEDALRILRAVRLSTELHFMIERETESAMAKTSATLERIARERIRDEFVRILISERPMEGLLLAHELGILKYIDTNLERGIGIEQNQAHKYNVFEHNLRTLQHAADKNWPLPVRLASLFHDISKPETRRFSKEKNDWAFHGHDVVGARLTKKILSHLRFSNDIIEKVVKLVRWHMFFSDPEQVTLSAVRRTIRNIGEENIDDLLNLRICDRIGTGRPKEQPFRFRKYKSMVEEALRDPLSVGMLEIDGNHIMEITGEKPGPRIGFMLHALLDEVLDDPKRNTKEYLTQRAAHLSRLKDEELKVLGE
jgi:putative nucleotidyltransferase with HDIG domain